jgi:hypothetical protein
VAWRRASNRSPALHDGAGQGQWAGGVDLERERERPCAAVLHADDASLAELAQVHGRGAVARPLAARRGRQRVEVEDDARRGTGGVEQLELQRVRGRVGPAQLDQMAHARLGRRGQTDELELRRRAAAMADAAREAIERRAGELPPTTAAAARVGVEVRRVGEREHECEHRRHDHSNSVAQKNSACQRGSCLLA